MFQTIATKEIRKDRIYAIKHVYGVGYEPIVKWEILNLYNIDMLDREDDRKGLDIKSNVTKVEFRFYSN